jgi:hypothetical protein
MKHASSLGIYNVFAFTLALLLCHFQDWDDRVSLSCSTNCHRNICRVLVPFSSFTVRCCQEMAIFVVEHLDEMLLNCKISRIFNHTDSDRPQCKGN